MMRHRDRVAMALAREEPDRCPMQISFTPEFAERLREDLGVRGTLGIGRGGQHDPQGGVGGTLGIGRGGQHDPQGGVGGTLGIGRGGQHDPQGGVGGTLGIGRGGQHNPHGGGNTYELERAIDSDLILTSVGWANSYYQGHGTYTDEWGVTWQEHPYETPFGTGHYTEMVGHPLAEDRAIETYRPPDPGRPELYVDSERVIRELGPEYWIVGVTVTTIWETAWALRGYQQLLMDLVADADLADRVLEIPFRYHLAAAERLAGMGIDMLWTGDDIGAQRGMLISPDTWRRFLKPRMAELIGRVKAIKPGLLVAYHTDGDVREVIDDLIEIGVDVLNPVQPACMDPAELKRRFGDRLLFWGSIDEQRTLPFGTPEEVAAQIRLRLETIGRGGGLILGPTHHVQLDTPLPNFWAMIDTIRETRYH
jgi:uroporphyrinogen decarboxylase